MLELFENFTQQTAPEANPPVVEKPPLVSIVIPCRQEKKTIAACLDAVLANDFPQNDLEVLVVDGRSTDGTRDIVNDYAAHFSIIRLLDNPRQNTPCALNIGICAARGEYILILSGHITIDRQFIKHNVEGIRATSADCVGGIIQTKTGAESRMSRLIEAVLTSPFAVGNAYFRLGVETPRAVDTVPYGIYRRQVFDHDNLFDERLIRNQDLEFNLRLKKNGGRIMLLPHIKSWYYAPSTLGTFLRQNFRNGFWVLKSQQFVRGSFSLRHLAPFCFVAGIAGSLIASLVYPPLLLFFYALMALYLPVNFYYAVRLARAKSRQVLSYMLLFLLVHCAYGAGSAFGALALVFRKEKYSHVRRDGTLSGNVCGDGEGMPDRGRQPVGGIQPDDRAGWPN